MLKQSFYSVPTRFQRQSKIMQKKIFHYRSCNTYRFNRCGACTLLGGKNKDEQFREMGQNVPAGRQGRT